MALNVTYPDSNGRIARVAGSNILIPPDNAGIGDIVFCLSGADPRNPSNLKVIGRGTNSARTATISNSTYYRYGVIYGFINGQAMVVADTDDNSARPAEQSKKWSTNSSVSIGPAVTTALLRNGNKHAYAAMNMARTYDVNSNYTGTTLHPTSAWTPGGLMSYSTFTGSNGATARAMYGEGLAGYYNYLNQVARVNGAPGTCFGITWDDATYGKVKVFDVGRVMTKLLHAASTSAYPAANFCATYTVSGTGESAGNWWLPSMFELGELMIDEHLNKVNEGLILDISNSAIRWSSVRCDGGGAWYYDGYGFSGYNGFSYEIAARPVTLLKLV